MKHYWTPAISAVEDLQVGLWFLRACACFTCMVHIMRCNPPKHSKRPRSTSMFWCDGDLAASPASMLQLGVGARQLVAFRRQGWACAPVLPMLRPLIWLRRARLAGCAELDPAFNRQALGWSGGGGNAGATTLGKRCRWTLSWEALSATSPWQQTLSVGRGASRFALRRFGSPRLPKRCPIEHWLLELERKQRTPALVQ